MKQTEKDEVDIAINRRGLAGIVREPVFAIIDDPFKSTSAAANEEIGKLLLAESMLVDPLASLNLTSRDRDNLALSMNLLGIAEVTTTHDGRQSVTRPYELAIGAEEARQALLGATGSGSEVVDAMRKRLSDELQNVEPAEPIPELEPITCPTCGAQHPRRVVQGHQIEHGAILLCPCETAMRVGPGPFAEAVDMKTCTNHEFVQILKARDAMKAARRQWKAHQQANRTAAERRRGR